MENIIAPIPVDLLLSELTPDKFIRKTNFGKNEIYVVTYKNAPNVLMEIGRLREISFREAGGGTGKATDIDDFDTDDNSYKQLIVWSPKEKEIVGGYRYIFCNNAPVDETGKVKIATSSLFDFSPRFVSEYMPHLIELGRSFVQPKYQSTLYNRKNIFSLDNLWDGLGALVVDYPQMKYFFGKVTMYKNFNPKARDIVLYFLKTFFADNENLVVPLEPLTIETNEEQLRDLFNGTSYEENYKILSISVRALGENIPPLVNSYMNLSPTMKSFGTVLNKGFGGVEETGILVKIDDIFPAKKERHISSYITSK